MSELPEAEELAVHGKKRSAKCPKRLLTLLTAGFERFAPLRRDAPGYLSRRHIDAR
jgi:hypothetical protein